MKYLVVFISMIVMTSSAFASETASLDRGKELFKDAQLGTNGKSCNVCHNGGRGMSKAAIYDEKKLVGIINRCIKASLAGKALDPGSAEMKSLVLYIKSLAPSSNY